MVWPACQASVNDSQKGLSGMTWLAQTPALLVMNTRCLPSPSRDDKYLPCMFMPCAC